MRYVLSGRLPSPKRKHIHPTVSQPPAAPSGRPADRPSAREPLFVTRPHRPNRARVDALLDGVWERNWLTNNGPLVRELTERLGAQLGVDHFTYVNNGTAALQVALRALGVTGSVITSPLSYVATANAIALEGLTPVFADVDPESLCLDPARLAGALRSDTSAILPVHVYGRPCDTEAIDAFAAAHGLVVLYDAAHAFGCRYRGRALADYGAAATLSFHATKVYHTVEGGGVVVHDPGHQEAVKYIHAHGHAGDDYRVVGLNAKNSELHAAVGLANLDDHADVVASRRAAYERYGERFASVARVDFLRVADHADLEYNYAYAPALLPDEAALLTGVAALEAEGIFARRYFYPALNTLPQFPAAAGCPVAESAAKRVLCLPLYDGLPLAEVDRVCDVLIAALP